MKHFLSILCLACVLTSCLDETDSHYVPRIANSAFVAYSSDTIWTADTFSVRYHIDTLRLRQDTDGYRLDTVAVGDTVRFAIGFDAMGNNLLTARVSWDSAYVALTFHALDSVNNVLLPTSDPAAGVFNLPNGYQGLVLPMEFVASKTGTPQMTFTAETDSKYSPAEVNLKTPIK